jgi:hypothetical protein
VGYASPADDPTVDLPVGLQILGPLLGHVLEGVMKEKVDAKRPKIW